ncbi:TerD family protein [Chenggangzhangella methanolivorans]|uniref:TerD family protein n=1 Tax=Chenggangzhangella methanolivorans TaxID=1437009 RepID=A0A9E6R9L3_9HYPH|nr:TerD family protein [Chenggangzhangella methanolivorans]QZO00644.1 TerD family protein [Chenggangzhangella methanolivorans]
MISLSKGQTINLSKESSGLARVMMGLGWDAVKKKGFFGFGGGSQDIDLDASVITFDSNRQPLDAIWFRQLKSKDGSIVHSGDNRTGDGDGDDETIRVDLAKLPAQVTDLVFVVNSFAGQNFNEVDNAVARLVDEATGKELARYELREKGSHTGVVMAVVSRRSGEWTMKAVGQPAPGRTVQDLVSPAMAAL